ncbi:MAG TPA: ATP-binding protein [Candidatus Tectomicrobia bacterium]|jgi:PAS domain S-box-containing protein
MADAPQTITQLLREIDALRQRLEALAVTDATVHDAIEVQQSTLEELQATEEELRQQNDELLVARQTVEAERERYEALFDLAPDGYLVTNAAGIIQEANRAAAALLGSSQEEMTGKPLLVYVTQEDAQSFHTQLSHLTRVQRIHDWELRLSRSRGMSFPASITVAVRQHPREQHMALYWLIHDLTEHKRAEDERRRNAHLALLGKLATGVSHDIRNPLANIFVLVDLMAEELQQPAPESAAQIAESLAEIKINLARLDNLVQDYLSLARLHSLQCEPMDLEAFVSDVVQEMMATVTRHGVRLYSDGLATLHRVALHKHTFRRALLNLVQNALEAMPEGGTLTFRGQQTALHVALDISDTGIGIPANRLEQIFEPLYTTKSAGTGLGLYLVREIVTAHHGEVRVTSRVNYGTTFTITLPVAGAEARAAGRA